MLEGKVLMPSLHVAQVVTKFSIEEDLAKLQAKLTANTIAIFDKSDLKEININLLSEDLLIK